MRKYRVTTQPASEPVSLVEAKLHLKVDYSTDDDLITALIIAAREQAENYTLRKLLPQTITEKFNGLTSPLELSCTPLRAITSFTYLDENGDSQALSTGLCVLEDYRDLPAISLKNSQVWPTTLAQNDAVTVVYTVGYDDADAVPATIKAAMLLMIGHWYENRQDTVRKMPTQSEHLLRFNRVMI